MIAIPRSCSVKVSRTEAVRVRLKHRRDEQDYQAILEVAAKLPGKATQEAEKSAICYDIATMRLRGNL